MPGDDDRFQAQMVDDNSVLSVMFVSPFLAA
jgi:hypothetical protein